MNHVANIIFFFFSKLISIYSIFLITAISNLVSWSSFGQYIYFFVTLYFLSHIICFIYLQLAYYIIGKMGLHFFLHLLVCFVIFALYISPKYTVSIAILQPSTLGGSPWHLFLYIYCLIIIDIIFMLNLLFSVMLPVRYILGSNTFKILCSINNASNHVIIGCTYSHSMNKWLMLSLLRLQNVHLSCSFIFHLHSSTFVNIFFNKNLY